MARVGAQIPFNRFVTVATSGLVAYLAIWQGVFSSIEYRPCIVRPDYVLTPNLGAAATQFGLALVALIVLFYGAKHLRRGFDRDQVGYTATVLSLLVGEGLLAFIFIRLSACAV